MSSESSDLCPLATIQQVDNVYSTKKLNTIIKTSFKHKTNAFYHGTLHSCVISVNDNCLASMEKYCLDIKSSLHVNKQFHAVDVCICVLF